MIRRVLCCPSSKASPSLAAGLMTCLLPSDGALSFIPIWCSCLLSLQFGLAWGVFLVRAFVWRQSQWKWYWKRVSLIDPQWSGMWAAAGPGTAVLLRYVSKKHLGFDNKCWRGTQSVRGPCRSDTSRSDPHWDGHQPHGPNGHHLWRWWGGYRSIAQQFSWKQWFYHQHSLTHIYYTT